MFGLGLGHDTGQVHVDKSQRIKEGGVGGHRNNGGFLGAHSHPPHGNPVKAAHKEHPSAQKNYQRPQGTRKKGKRACEVHTLTLDTQMETISV